MPKLTGTRAGAMAGASMLACAAVFTTMPQPASAQPDGDEPSETTTATDAEPVEVVVVEGRRPRGVDLSDLAPELSLGEADIAAYGVSSIGGLVDALLAETSSGRGRRDAPPVVLLNGRRISGFREIGRYPAEAVARVEVLPEEASLSYGFSADQRVINFILKPNVTITAFEGAVESPQEGGSTASEGSGQRLFVDGDTRFSIDARGRARPPVFEAERDVRFNGDPAEAAFRTLLSDRHEWGAGFSAGRAVWGGATATLSGAFDRAVDDDQLGFDLTAEDTSLDQRRQVDDANLGFSLVSRLAPTTWNLTTQYNLIDTDTQTEFNRVDAPTRETRSTSSRRGVVATDFVVNKKLAQLPAGALALTGQTGYQREDLAVEIDDFTGLIESDAARDTVSSRFSLDAPLIAPGPAPGDVTLNGNIEIEDVSDFGLLTTFGYGLTWRATDTIRIIASTTREEGAPALDAVGGPTIITPGVRVFDFAAGADAFVEVTDGANPDLVVDNRRVVKVGVQYGPFEETDIRFNIDYTRSRIEDETRTFFALTEEFEAAFPDRVVRDATGALVAFDRRPVVVAETRRDEVRTGLNWTKRLQSPPTQASGASGTDGAGGARPTKRRRSGRPGQIRLSAYHRWTLRDEVVVADGLAPFDFLDGAAPGRFGGTPAHVVDFSLYRWNNGLGAFLGGNYQTGTEVAAPDGALSFSDLLVANFRLTYQFNYNDRVLRWAPFLKETRIAVGVSNVFDEKIQVTDAAGATPVTFQEDVIDPLGRVFRFELRRRF